MQDSLKKLWKNLEANVICPVSSHWSNSGVTWDLEQGWSREQEEFSLFRL